GCGPDGGAGSATCRFLAGCRAPETTLFTAARTSYGFMAVGGTLASCPWGGSVASWQWEALWLHARGEAQWLHGSGEIPWLHRREETPLALRVTQHHIVGVVTL